VTLQVEQQPPIVFDLGTGLRGFGVTQPTDGSFRATALLTHIHWDHVQGLPFFPPADRPGASFDIYGPAQEEGTLAEMFDGLMRPPYFPVRFSDLRGDIVFRHVPTDSFRVGGATVSALPVPHNGPTVGYRVEWDGVVVAYISDHQAPADLDTVSEAVLELARGADLLIHDAQFTREEFAEKAHWGHCTVDYAVSVAVEAGVRTLALFHHDPAHDDDQLDGLLSQARQMVGGDRLQVVAARDGERLRLGEAPGGTLG
jgi:phosphoribosyl 1,2-cyclic phosphodiesterase